MILSLRRLLMAMAGIGYQSGAVLMEDMLPASSDQRADSPIVRSVGGLALTVLHYAICALAIGFGLLGFIDSVLRVVSDVEPGQSTAWTVSGWIATGGIFLVEMAYRPSFKVTARFGFAALLLLCLWITANVLVSLTI